MAHTYHGNQPCPVGHTITTEELPGVVQDVVSNAQNAMDEEFYGVESHVANE